MRHPAARPDCGKLSAARYLREKSVICNPWRFGPRVYAFELTHIKGHGLSLCKPKHPLVCKCANVQMHQRSAPVSSANLRLRKLVLVLTTDR